LLALINGLGALSPAANRWFFLRGHCDPALSGRPFPLGHRNATAPTSVIYTVDAAGLRAESSDAETSKAIARIGQKRLGKQ